MTNEIDSILDSYHPTTLWEMSTAANLTVTDEQGKRLRKADLLAVVRAEFFAESRIRQSWQRLSQREQSVVNQLLLRGGTARTNGFRRQVVRARLATQVTKRQHETDQQPSVPYSDGYTGHPGRSQSLTFEDIIARLTYHGIVFSRGTVTTSGGVAYKLRFHPGRIVFVPQVVRRSLPEPEEVANGFGEWQPERIQMGDPSVLLRDLYLYWDFVRRNDVVMTRAGFVGKRWLRKANTILIDPDPTLDSARREDDVARLYLLRRLLESLGLVQATDGMLRTVQKSPSELPQFWLWEVDRQMGACIEAWLASDSTAGLDRDAGQYGPRVAHAQQQLIDALGSVPADAWLEPDDILETVQENDADFLFREHTRVKQYQGNWYYGYASGHYYGSRKDLLKTFIQYESQFIKECLGGFLYQIGLLDLGFSGSGPGELLAVRLSQHGLAVLRPDSPQTTDSPTSVDEGKLIIQPNFQIIALGPVSLATLAWLDLIADRETVDHAAFQYRLTRESLYRGQQMGIDQAEALRFLEQAVGVDLPQNIQRSMEEWAALHERIVFRTGVSLVQAANAAMLSQLVDDPKVGIHLARSVTTSVAFVKERQGKVLTSALVDQGLFPAVTYGEQETLEGSVTIDQDGVIHPVHTLPGLHLSGRLSQLAEETGPSVWRLTPTSVGRVSGSRETVKRLLDELQNLHRGPFPAELADQIKAWGGYFGSAGIGTFTLIEFRDQIALDELLNQPELEGLLTPFAAGDRALAIVQSDQVDQIVDTLERLGVKIDHKLAQ